MEAATVAMLVALEICDVFYRVASACVAVSKLSSVWSVGYSVVGARLIPCRVRIEKCGIVVVPLRANVRGAWSGRWLGPRLWCSNVVVWC